MKQHLGILALLLAATTAVAPAAVKPTRIAVGGSATVNAVPTVATVSVAVVSNAESASDAVGENSATYERVAAAIERLGIAKSAIALGSYNVDYNPRPNPMPSNPPPYARYGYTVTRSFDVRVGEIAKAGSVIDAATAAGATQINGVSFGLADQSAAKAQATAKAVADARTKAQQVAAAAGLHITRIASISLDAGGGGIQPLVRMSAMAAKEPTTLNPGDVSVSSNVTIVFDAQP
ncbi:MAG: SIMPL domain-containing protein [bacterium]|nr:SIMPL domain-containing protein [bacterium]